MAHNHAFTSTAFPPPAERDKQDELRFSSIVKEKATRPVGAYAADVCPGPSTHSATGTIRGEELFHRPDLERGWRTATKQKYSELVAGKEVEIEFLTRRNAEFRQQAATAERETQRAQHRLLVEAQASTENQMAFRAAAERTMAAANDQVYRIKDQCDKKIAQLTAAHEEELRLMDIRQREQREAGTAAAATLQRALEEIKESAAREVQLSLQLADARVAELQAALTASHDALQQTHARHQETLNDLRAEAKKADERAHTQVKDAEKRAEDIRIRVTADLEVATSQREEALAVLSATQEKERLVRNELNGWENRFREWVARTLGEIERINEAFVSSIREMQDAEMISTEQASLLDRPGADKELRDLLLPAALTQSIFNVDALMKRTVEQVAVLARIRDRHSKHSTRVIERLREALLHVATVEQKTDRRAHDGALQLAQFSAELREVRARQERIEQAVNEVRKMCHDSVNAASAASCRVQFIADDLKSRSELDIASSQMPSIANMPAPVPNSSASSGVGSEQQQQSLLGECKHLTFLLCTVEGTSQLWQKVPQIMSIASPMVASILRSHCALNGGVVAVSEGDASLLAFPCPVSALRCTVDVQIALEKAPWPAGLQQNIDAVCPPASPEAAVKGLRLGVCVHSGPSELVELRAPWGVTFGAASNAGSARYCYTGKAIAQLFQLASLVHGGQIVATAYTWSFVAHRSSELGALVDVKDLGTYKVGEMGGESASDGELQGLLSVCPLELAAFRRFLSPTETDHFRDTRRGTGIPHEAIPIFRWNSDAVARSLAERSIQNADAARILREEFVGLNQSVAAIHVRVKEAEANAKRYTAADAVAHVTAMDKLSIRADIFATDVERLTRAQKRLAGQVGVAEEKIAAVSRTLLTEEEFKRRLQTLTSRCSEVISDATTRADRRVAELQAAMNQSNAIQESLRKQLTKYLVAQNNNPLAAAATATSMEQQHREDEERKKAEREATAAANGVASPSGMPRKPATAAGKAAAAAAAAATGGGNRRPSSASGRPSAKYGINVKRS